VFFGVVSTFSVAISWCAGLSVAASILEFMDNSSLTRVGHPVVAARQAAMGLRLVREADARGAKRLEYTVCPITRQ
jgi:hypothetical protein